MALRTCVSKPGDEASHVLSYRFILGVEYEHTARWAHHGRREVPVSHLWWNQVLIEGLV